jgi:hypothetical protein
VGEEVNKIMPHTILPLFPFNKNFLVRIQLIKKFFFLYPVIFFDRINISIMILIKQGDFLMPKNNDDYIEFNYDEEYEISSASYMYDNNYVNEDKDTHIDENTLIDDLDNDVQLTRKEHATTIKRKKKPEVLFNVGDKVMYRKKIVTVIFGPYEKNYKQVYELLTDEGSVVSAIATSIKKI